MIKLENYEVVGWKHAIRGMRNPMNSWDKSDSDYRTVLAEKCDKCGKYDLPDPDSCTGCWINNYEFRYHWPQFIIGPEDYKLMMKLRNAGNDHRKYMRMLVVYVDITAPLYWWKEFDTYKVGTVANSCSTMHKIHAKEFTLADFSYENLLGIFNEDGTETGLIMDVSSAQDGSECFSPCGHMGNTVKMLNICRNQYLKTKDKTCWDQMIQLLPTSYNQKRTVMLNYEVLANIYKSRKNHKLAEWHALCNWIKELPYSEIITGGEV